MVSRRQVLSSLPAGLAALSSSASATSSRQPTEELAETQRVLTDAFKGANIGQIVALHAPDAFVAYGTGATSNHADLSRVWQTYFAPQVGPDGVAYERYHPIEVDHVEAQGDLGFARGRYWHGEKGAGPEKYRAGGYFTGVWKRFPEGWRIIAFNSTATREPPPLRTAVGAAVASVAVGRGASA